MSSPADRSRASAPSEPPATSPQGEPGETSVGTALRRRARARWQPASVVMVAVAWLLLWDRPSLGNLVNGLLVGLFVTWLFPLPPITLSGGRVRPLRVLAIIARFLADMSRASFQVAAIAFRPRPPHNAVIGVRLRTHNDLVLTLVAEITGLVPGSVVIEARRASSELYLHLLDVNGPEDLKRARERVLDLERRIVLAIGSPEEIALVSAPGEGSEGAAAAAPDHSAPDHSAPDHSAPDHGSTRAPRAGKDLP